MNSNLDELKKIVDKSPFHLAPNRNLNLRFKSLFEAGGGITEYSDRIIDSMEHSPLDSDAMISLMTPAFQRSNKKWSRSMKTQFMENLMGGCATNIQFYSIKGGETMLGNCKILDGLQRLTACSDYQLNKFPVFGKYYWRDVNHGGTFPRLRLQLSIYEFDTEIEACEHYIHYNRGITHSEEDLQTAYEFMSQQHTDR